MSQDLLSLNGGLSPVVTTVNPGQQTYLSRQYADVKSLNPYPTEWTEGGRPIYGRLPQVYKVLFDSDPKSAYVYVPVGVPAVGPGSLQVQSSGGNKFLVIQAGVIVWREGNVPLDSVIIDLQLVGLKSTRYFIGYQLYADSSPFAAQYTVEEYSLAGSEMNLLSSTDPVTGWRYQPAFAFSNSDNFYWSNYDGLFPDFAGSPYLCWQTEYPNAYSSLKMRCPQRTAYTGTATLYYQACASSGEEKYCSQPEWVPQETVTIQADTQGQYFEFNLEDPSFQTGWRVEWTDPRISIQSVTVSGTLTLLRRPTVPVTYCQLVAYPQNAVPDTTLNSIGEEVPVTMCGLAIVETNNIYEVTSVTDIRETINGEYQPVADWMTRTWDESLINLRRQVLNFPEYWMNPGSCLKQEYFQFEENLITVEK